MILKEEVRDEQCGKWVFLRSLDCKRFLDSIPFTFIVLVYKAAEE